MTDCFAYIENGCTALRVNRCVTSGRCSFYKSKDTHVDELHKSIEHMQSLDALQQNRMSDTYYGGEIPHIRQ